MGQRERATLLEGRFSMSRPMMLLLSAASGLAAANLYYSQPLLAEISRFFDVSFTLAGTAAMLIQIGYAVGLVFLVPLGDIKEQRSLIITMLCCSMLALFGLSFAPSLGWLMVGSFMVGLTSVTPMLIVALAAHLAEPTSRGRIIGNIMTGLLIGILLSRTVSGFVGSALGWQTIYRVAGAMMGLLAVVFRFSLPRCEPKAMMHYGRLLKSLAGLCRSEATLRQSSLIGAMMFATFSVFWTTLSFLLKSLLHGLSTQAAGMFGLAGIAGALAASVAGRVADRKGPRYALTVAIALSSAAFICFWAFANQIWGLVAGVILLDLGIQSGQISNQARVNSLDAGARSRNNAIYMAFYFGGGALGSFTGSWCWGLFGWAGVCAVGILFQIIAAAAHASGYRTRATVPDTNSGRT